MQSTTVRRNTREARAIWGNATRAVTYTLENCFAGEDVTVDGAHDWYERITARGAKPSITRLKHGYRVHYHSNHWTDLLCPPASCAACGPNPVDAVCYECGRGIDGWGSALVREP